MQKSRTHKPLDSQDFRHPTKKLMSFVTKPTQLDVSDTWTIVISSLMKQSPVGIATIKYACVSAGETESFDGRYEGAFSLFLDVTVRGLKNERSKLCLLINLTYS